jgi:hypothetical protein
LSYKLGKLPAVKNSVSLRLRDYLTLAKLPIPPARVNHQTEVTDWGMLGNDQYGDCVWAGAGHETMAWNKTSGTTVTITTDNALSDYTAVTGFNINKPDTDKGTDMSVAAKYRQNTGVIDASNARHKVAAYLAITPGNREELKQAVYLFENVGVGIEFPASAMTQFNDGKPWTVVKGSAIQGGHYVPALGYDGDYIYVISWAKVQKMAWTFFDKYCDEAIVYFSEEMLKTGESIEGFNVAQLQQDLKEF